MAATPALRALHRSGIEYRIHRYPSGAAELHGADPYGLVVAGLIGVDPARVFKTLVALVDDRPVLAVIPVGARLTMKALAGAASGKKAVMADPEDAQRWTGYVVGGISPIAQKRGLEAFVDESAADHDTIFVSAGRRGLQVELAPGDLVTHLGARLARLT